MRKTLLAAAPILMLALAPTSSHADNVGAAFGAGTGLLLGGPVGLVVGGVVGWVWGVPSGARRLTPEHVSLTITGTGTAGTMAAIGTDIKLSVALGAVSASSRARRPVLVAELPGYRLMRVLSAGVARSSLKNEPAASASPTGPPG